MILSISDSRQSLQDKLLFKFIYFYGILPCTLIVELHYCSYNCRFELGQLLVTRFIPT